MSEKALQLMREDVEKNESAYLKMGTVDEPRDDE